MKQPVSSPDTNVLDYSIWNAIERKLTEEEDDYKSRTGKEWKENIENFSMRVQTHFWALEKAYIQKSMLDLKRRCKEIIANNGEILTYD